MHIRLAIADDIPTLISIERHSVTAAHWTEQDYRAIFEQSTPRRVAMVIETDDQQLPRGVHGFIVARYFEDEWEIENIAVAPTERRRGLASSLLQGFLSYASSNGGREVLLEVRESNIAARRLYAKCNFIEAGRRKSYYSNPLEDAVLLRRPLVASTCESC